MRRIPSRLIAAALLGLCLLLPACFDCGLELLLKADGAGRLSAYLELPAPMAGQYESQSFQEILKPETPLKRQERDGLVEYKQKVNFTALNTVEAARMRFELARIDKGLLGLRDDTYRLTGWLRSLEGDRPDRDQPLGTELDHKRAQAGGPAQPLDPDAVRANQLLSASLAGRFLTVSWQVPGKIIQVWDLDIAGRLVKPQVKALEGKVVWRVPLALLATAQVRHNLVFRADFKGDVRVAGEAVTQIASTWPRDEGQAVEKKEEGKPGEGKPGEDKTKGEKPKP